MTTYHVQFEWEEDGCYLLVNTDLYEREPYRFKLEDPEQTYDTVKAAILPWLMERDMHRASYMREAQESPDFAEGWVEMLGRRAVATREDGSLRMEPDEEPDDWRERLADNADHSRKVAKGE